MSWGLQPLFHFFETRLLDDDMASDTERLSSAEPLEKDETEVQLEKLVFGDNAGFHEKLKSYNDDDDDTDLRGVVDGAGQKARGGFDVDYLEGLDDADVCKDGLPVETLFAQNPSSCSSSTPLRPL